MSRQGFEISGRPVGAGRRLFLIAGPCVIEDEGTMMRVAEFMASLAGRHGLTFIFKSSFLKANRTSQDSPEGPGLEKGLEILRRIGKSFGLPVCTDVHEVGQVAPAAEVAEVLQIPSFLCRQSALIRAAAATGRVVNIKKGQFMDPGL
ncbi:MAG: 3-deoxy-8-phosphooctulonate synthase, partial [Candidatus Glassbacteria bacterium]|nr:3-deoxy-8-phosphooctulonate synthase [Candidatus Glassbacteria bacterium]